MFKGNFIVSGAEVNLSSDTSPQTLGVSLMDRGSRPLLPSLLSLSRPCVFHPAALSVRIPAARSKPSTPHAARLRFLIPSDGLCIAFLSLFLIRFTRTHAGFLSLCPYRFIAIELRVHARCRYICIRCSRGWFPRIREKRSQSLPPFAEPRES